MRFRALALTLLLSGIFVAGCAGTKTEVRTEVATRPPVSESQGAVTGLVIDDRYRPVSGATVLLTPAGRTATTDTEGQFGFGDLDVGSYILQVQAPDHEAAPKAVDVAAAEYSEVEIVARRTFSQGSSIVTLQYALFTPCAESAVLVSTVHEYCMPDLSGDSYRPGLQGMDFRPYHANLTYLVGEILINQPDNYVFVLRCDDGSSFGCGEFGANETNGGNYGKVTLQNGAMYMQQYDTGVNWTNASPMAALLFYYGTGGQQVTSVAKPVGCQVSETVPIPPNPLNGKPLLCRTFYGAGHKYAIEARIVLSLFLGEPDGDIASYGVLASH